MKPTLAVAFVAALTAAACDSSSSSAPDLLPGRTRPLLNHGWPHPRDYEFSASRFRAPDPASALVRTDNGLRAFVSTDAADPLVRVAAVLPLGRFFETPNEVGAADLLASLVVRGAAGTGRSVVDEVEARGAQLEVDQQPDLTIITIDALKQDWRPLLAQLLASLRGVRIDERTTQTWRSGPGYAPVTASVAGHGFRPKVELERLFGDAPFAPAPPGTAVSRTAVAALAARTLRPDAVVLGIGGGVSRTEVEAFLREQAGEWAPSGDARPAARSVGALRAPSATVFVVDEPAYTGWVALGFPLAPVSEPDLAAFAVLTELINIRLNITVREIRGLANKTSLEVPADPRRGGLLHVRTGGRAEAVAPLIHYSRDELARMTRPDVAIDESELEDVKGGLVLSQWQRRLDGARTASMTFAVETVRFGGVDALLAWPQRVRAVTADAVRRTARTYLKPESLVAVVIGPISKIRPARHPRWPFALDDLEGRRSTN